MVDHLEENGYATKCNKIMETGKQEISRRWNPPKSRKFHVNGLSLNPKSPLIEGALGEKFAPESEFSLCLFFFFLGIHYCNGGHIDYFFNACSELQNMNWFVHPHQDGSHRIRVIELFDQFVSTVS